MSLQYPSIPLNASDAKLLADEGVLQAKKITTDAWLVNASVQITNAAKAGNYSLSLAFDGTVNTDQIIKQLADVLGYTTTLLHATDFINVDWQSAQRTQIAPLPDSTSNFGYKAN